ncbi:hypothetical protein BGZ76_008162 [Entomortierella beljakovae]|nr:hypothetical protein BGZ76_008162 [Entomortierella beljakovae]
MSNKPTAKAIAKLNATTLFPEIRKEIEKKPTNIRGFFIFNITKKGKHMTEWYLLFQGFDAPAIVSQKRPELPKAKRDEQPIPVAIIQIEDSDLLNLMSGGLTGSRGIISGKIKIAGAIEMAEELENVFKKAKGTEKTLAYLEKKRGARARLASSPPPAGGNKVQNLARRYSAMAKQAASESNYVPQNTIEKPQVPIKAAAPKSTTATTAAAAATTTTKAAAVATSNESETIQEQHEDEEEEEVVKEVAVAELSDKVNEIDLTEEPVHEEPESMQEEEEEKQEPEPTPEPVKQSEPEPVSVQEELIKEQEQEQKQDIFPAPVPVAATAAAAAEEEEEEEEKDAEAKENTQEKPKDVSDDA